MKNYSELPRIFICPPKERLDDFDVDNEQSLNGQLYRILQSIEFLDPYYKETEQSLLHILNDAYYISTMAFLDHRPLMCLGEYCTNERKSIDWANSNHLYEIEPVVMGVVWCILESYKEHLPKKIQELKKAIDTRFNKEMYEKNYRIVVTQVDWTTVDCPSEPLLPLSVNDIRHTYYNWVEQKDNHGFGLFEDILRYLCWNKEERLQLIDYWVTYTHTDTIRDIRNGGTGITVHFTDIEPKEKLHGWRKKVEAGAMPYEMKPTLDSKPVQTTAEDKIRQLESELTELKNQLEDCREKARGLSPAQAALFVEALATYCHADVKNKKDDLAPIANKLFGWQISTIEKRLCEGYSLSLKKEVADIIRDMMPALAVIIDNGGSTATDVSPDK